MSGFDADALLMLANRATTFFDHDTLPQVMMDILISAWLQSGLEAMR